MNKNNNLNMEQGIKQKTITKYQEMITTTTTTKNSLIVPTPSSPREFFARIYGHLETNDNNKTINKEDKINKITNETIINDNHEFSDSNNSVSSSDVEVNDDEEEDISNRRQWNKSRISEASSNEDPLPRVQGASNDIVGQVSPIAPGIPGPPYWFPTLPFHAGLSAFLSRRRRAGARPRRQRTTFSAAQTLRLEVEFRRAEYVARAKRLELASSLRLSETQVKIWFQNRRAKDKRIEKAQLDQHYRQLAATTGLVPGYYPRPCALCLYRGDTACPHQLPHAPALLPPAPGVLPTPTPLPTPLQTISPSSGSTVDERGTNNNYQKQLHS